ncbi:MAG: hypothetical protein K1X81_14015 [Bacteroidia bacterium]|nr:hypothetical protein [Bacteroidia bacterium]
MKTKRLLIVVTMLCLLQSTKTFAQTDTLCGYQTAYNWLVQQDSSYLNFEIQHVENIKRYRNWKALNAAVQLPPITGSGYATSAIGCPKAKFIVPVAVHIIHDPTDTSLGSGTNISDAQVENQIEELNKYFAGQSGGVNTGIQFCLTYKDINGNTQKRITRRGDNLTTNHLPSEIDDVMALDKLDQTRYLNIWVVKTILTDGGQDIGVRGYSTMPGRIDVDGIVVRYNSFGNYNNCSGCNLASPSRGNTLAHEVGHYLGIWHTFQDSCAGNDTSDCALKGDRCCDTPPMLQNSGCNYSSNTCHNESPDEDDPIENFMSYSSESCKTSFTQDQADIMHTTLYTHRSSLVQPSWLAQVSSCCNITATFEATALQRCSGDTSAVYFSSIASSGRSYQWFMYRNDTLIDSSGVSGNAVYAWHPSQNGMYTIALRVIDGSDTISEVRSNYVQRLDCGTPLASPYGNWYFGQYCELNFKQGGSVISGSCCTTLFWGIY